MSDGHEQLHDTTDWMDMFRDDDVPPHDTTDWIDMFKDDDVPPDHEYYRLFGCYPEKE